LVNEVRIYFEGDGALRPGFSQFLAEIKKAARDRGIGFHLIAGGATAEKDYHTALRKRRDAWNVLLRDSEGSEPPKSGSDDHFWMVQLMEAWFLADPEALSAYYGDDFNGNALKKKPQIEEIPKGDVLDCLREASKKTLKGRYHKTKHAPEILERIDPLKVRKAAPHCENLFRRLLTGLDQGR